MEPIEEEQPQQREELIGDYDDVHCLDEGDPRLYSMQLQQQVEHLRTTVQAYEEYINDCRVHEEELDKTLVAARDQISFLMRDNRELKQQLKSFSITGGGIAFNKSQTTQDRISDQSSSSDSVRVRSRSASPCGGGDEVRTDSSRTSDDSVEKRRLHILLVEQQYMQSQLDEALHECKLLKKQLKERNRYIKQLTAHNKALLSFDQRRVVVSKGSSTDLRHLVVCVALGFMCGIAGYFIAFLSVQMDWP